MFFKSFVFALGAASTVSATVCVGICNADNCLRALRATQISTRLPQASLDCKRIVDVTYTPPAVTITEYTTISQTNTVTIPTTLVKSFYDTYTDVIQATATTDQLVTVTRQAKRDVAATSISFPVYATPCSGFYRFSSACSCIGVTPSIFTAPTPSTTLTLPVTETSLTSVLEVETTSITITDATVSVTTTVTTVTNIVESTVEPPVTEITGVARLVIGGVTQDAWMGTYESGGIDYGFVTTSVSAAMNLRLDEDGHLWSGGKVAKGNPANSGVSSLQFFFVTPETATGTRSPFTCTKDANNYLKCVVGPQTPPAPLAFTWRSSNFIYSASLANSAASGAPIIELKLIS